MLRMALPHVNVLSKIDLIGQAGDLGMRLPSCAVLRSLAHDSLW